MQSVPDLQSSMYKVVDGDPCVRLLNLSGEIGCSSKLLNGPFLYVICSLLIHFDQPFCLLHILLDPGREKVVAPIIRFRDANSLSRSSAVLLSLDEIQDFFIRYVYHFFVIGWLETCC